MAVAAYASLVSLTHVLDNLHYRAELQCPCLDIKLIETLQESVHFLLYFVEVNSLRKRDGIDSLWRGMAEVAFEAEDHIDFHVVNALRGGSPKDTHDVGYSTTFYQDMQKVIEKIEFIKKGIPIDQEEEEDAQPRIDLRVSVAVGGSKTIASGRKSVMVGFHKHVDKILDVLTSYELDLRIFPIVGTGGIGKTTLAKNIFEHPLTNYRFDICIWVTISQEYSIHQILRRLLNEKENEENGESVAQLGERLHKKLFGRRFFVVMDDVWTTQVWDNLKMFFPNNGNGSWIMMTTRLLNVGDYVGSHSPYMIDFLKDDESWNLLSQNVFARDDCPHAELKESGRDIAKSCRGLPLLINAIGGLLAKSNLTKEYWEFVAQNVNALGNLENDEYCLRSLSLSYDNLPIHLKPCFLYMRVCPEDAEIEVSDLIKLWIAEGLIKLVEDKSLEELAEEYIKDLIDRNLMFVHQRTTRGAIRTCGMHDLLRDLCFRESAKECFNYLPKVQHWTEAYYTHMCFVCARRCTNEEPINVQEFVHFSSSTSEVSLFLCDACKKVYWPFKRLKLLRVMDVGSNDFVQPSGLRYASVVSVPYLQFVSPWALNLLWNLQTLKLHAYSTKNQLVLPSQIWEMPQLRHIHAYPAVLADPMVSHAERGDFIILKNLQTLADITYFKCTEDILTRIPNTKELKISVESDHPCDLTQLHKLESLSIDIEWKNFVLPESLKKLVLMSCKIPWKDMTIIGSLPNLEELKLHSSGEGQEWNPVEGEFCQLKVLSIVFCDVVFWRANPECFPKLEWLLLHHLRGFETPLDIGSMDTMRSIELHHCGERVVESAKKIVQEHRDMGNENLQIRVANVLGTVLEADASSPELETMDWSLFKGHLIQIRL